MKSNYSALTAVTFTLALLCHSHIVSAAPLFGGSLLGIEAGGSPDADGQCATGSCFGMEVSPGFWIWTMVSPGNDGGFIVGKNQLSGGQELAPSPTNATPGDITAAWSFFGAFGTFFADNALNTFSDTSNDGTTVLNDFNVAWNGSFITMTGPLAQGSMNNYTITLDGAGGGSWNMDYTAVVPDGPFIGVNFRLHARGAVAIAECVCAPVIIQQTIIAECGTTVNWTPDISQPPCSCNTEPDPILSCAIASNAINGNATINPDCSGGTYTAPEGYDGLDGFSYSVTDSSGYSATSSVDVVISCTPMTGDCDPDLYPIKQVTTVGGGQSPNINTSLQMTFTGAITTESGLTTGGKNTVKICPGTTIDFQTSSTIGVASCIINSTATAATGTLAIGDKLICTNKPDGSDTDRYTIKNGL